MLEQQVSDLMSHLTPDSLTEVEGTKGQNESEKWNSEQWPRMTASTCMNAYRAGKKVMEGSSVHQLFQGNIFLKSLVTTLKCTG